MSVNEPSSAATPATTSEDAPTPTSSVYRTRTPRASTHARAIPSLPAEDKVGHDGKLYLPLPHPLVHDAEPGSRGAWINQVWVDANYFMRGLYATGVEWCISMMDLALEYPRVALVSFVFVAVVSEETLSEHPMLSNTVRYVMFSIDPKAAEEIFPVDVEPSEASLAIDKLAAEIIRKSAEDYYRSPEYKQLELDVRARMHQEVMESVYLMAGIQLGAAESLQGEAVPIAPPEASPEDVAGAPQ